jgi:hypothetical protein
MSKILDLLLETSTLLSLRTAEDSELYILAIDQLLVLLS